MFSTTVCLVLWEAPDHVHFSLFTSQPLGAVLQQYFLFIAYERRQIDGRYGFPYFVALGPANAGTRIQRTLAGAATSLNGDLPHIRSVASG